MKKTKIISVFLLIMYVFALAGCVLPDSSTTPSNAKTNCIYGEELKLIPGQEISIPVKIKNNQGFSGFEIMVNYDASILTPREVICSSELATGIMNDSIETAQDNSFSVIWSGIGNITADCQLFTVVFDVSSQSNDTTTISLSYVQENTVDDDIEEVEFNCSDIKLIAKEELDNE